MWLTLIFVILLLKLFAILTIVRCKSNVCLIGKRALITGGYSGIGLELAKQLAARGCTIIIADKHDASQVVRNIINETHNPNVSCRIVNFGSFQSVRKFAEKFKNDIDKLDIMVNNAGISDGVDEITEDGLQLIMQVNYFSHFLLIHLLLDILLKSAPSRIIYTGSLLSYWANLSEDTLGQCALLKRNILNHEPYSNSKLAGVIMSKLLARKLEGTDVTSNTLCPGLVKTSIWNSSVMKSNVRFYLSMLINFIFGKSTEEGVQTALYMACADELTKTSGKFFKECMSIPQPLSTYDEEFCEKIWQLSEKYTKLNADETIESIVKNHCNKLK